MLYKKIPVLSLNKLKVNREDRKLKTTKNKNYPLVITSNMKVKETKTKICHLKRQYFDMIKSYLIDVINNHKTQFGE